MEFCVAGSGLPACEGGYAAGTGESEECCKDIGALC